MSSREASWQGPLTKGLNSLGDPQSAYSGDRAGMALFRRSGVIRRGLQQQLAEI